jgi:hypothetical protein
MRRGVRGVTLLIAVWLLVFISFVNNSLVALSESVNAQSSSASDSITVTATVLATAPLINSLDKNQVTTRYSRTITISGFCTYGTIVKVFSYEDHFGQSRCSPDSTFSINGNLKNGTNNIRARHFAPDPVSPFSDNYSVRYLPLGTNEPIQYSTKNFQQFLSQNLQLNVLDRRNFGSSYYDFGFLSILLLTT